MSLFLPRDILVMAEYSADGYIKIAGKKDFYVGLTKFKQANHRSYSEHNIGDYRTGIMRRQRDTWFVMKIDLVCGKCYECPLKTIYEYTDDINRGFNTNRSIVVIDEDAELQELDMSLLIKETL